MCIPSNGGVVAAPNVLSRLFAQDAKTSKAAYAEITGVLSRSARRVHRFASKAWIEDVIQESLRIVVMRGGPAAVPLHVDDWAWLRNGVLRNAIEAVNAGLRPPGVRSRNRNSFPTDAGSESGIESVIDMMGPRLPAFDDAVNLRLDFDEAESRMDLTTRHALRVMIAENETVAGVARRLGISRSTLSRRIDSLRPAA